MNKFTAYWGGMLLAAALVSACGKTAPVPGVAASAVAPEQSVKGESALQAENEKLIQEIAELKAQVADLSQTPQSLFQSVQDAVKAEDVEAAQQPLEKLRSRFGDVPQTQQAQQAIAKLQQALQLREEQARRVEAAGFYALKEHREAASTGAVLRVESVKVGTRWTFDTHDDSWHYRDAEKGEKFVLLNALVQSEQKNPELPDVAVYRIDGKTMHRLSHFQYEFRRWSSYGTFIGLHHDFKNDFAHTKSVAFNAGASVGEEDLKRPLAVVVTGVGCHQWGQKIGQPEVTYRYKYSCDAKSDLTPEDFIKGDYRIVSFINRPKGA